MCPTLSRLNISENMFKKSLTWILTLLLWVGLSYFALGLIETSKVRDATSTVNLVVVRAMFASSTDIN
jgi:hypothetical protein